MKRTRSIVDGGTGAAASRPHPVAWRRLVRLFEEAKLDDGTEEGRKGEKAIDWWSLPHFAAGLLLGLLPLGWLGAAVAVVGYEVFEAGLRRVKTEDGGLFEHESWRNIFLDVVLGLAGFGIMHVAIFPFLPWPELAPWLPDWADGSR
jgi:hypothetical protein